MTIPNWRRPTVVHVRKSPFDVYIGRTGHGFVNTGWGNPFVVGRDGEVGECVLKYEQWIQIQPQLMARLHELRGKRLGCWCKPRACHGDVLARLVGGL